MLTDQPYFFFNLVLSYQPKTGRSPQENYRNYSKRSSFASTTNWNCEQCGLMIQHILAFDLLPESPLFEGEYSAEPNKSMLVFEAKKNDSNYWSFNLAKIFEIKHTASGGFHVQGMSIKNWLIQKIWWFMWMHLIYVNFIVEVVFRAVTDTYHLWFIRGNNLFRYAIAIIGQLFHPLISSAWLQIRFLPQQIKKCWASPCKKQNLISLAEIVIHRYNKYILLSFVINEDEFHPAKLFTVGQEKEVNAHSDS